MGMKMLKLMFEASESIGTIEKMNMFDKNGIYIEGKTKEGDKFSFNFIVEKTEETENA